MKKKRILEDGEEGAGRVPADQSRKRMGVLVEPRVHNAVALSSTVQHGKLYSFGRLVRRVAQRELLQERFFVECVLALPICSPPTFVGE